MLYESLQRFARILHPDFRREALKADHAVQIGAVVHETRAAVGGIAHFRFKAEPVLRGRIGQRGDLGGIARAAVIDERFLGMDAAPLGRHVEFDARNVEPLGRALQKRVQRAVGQRIIIAVYAHPAAVDDAGVNVYADGRKSVVAAPVFGEILAKDDGLSISAGARRVVAEPQARPEHGRVGQQAAGFLTGHGGILPYRRVLKSVERRAPVRRALRKISGAAVLAFFEARSGKSGGRKSFFQYSTNRERARQESSAELKRSYDGSIRRLFSAGSFAARNVASRSAWPDVLPPFMARSSNRPGAWRSI